jgi:hypothetical protein
LVQAIAGEFFCQIVLALISLMGERDRTTNNLVKKSTISLLSKESNYAD